MKKLIVSAGLVGVLVGGIGTASLSAMQQSFKDVSPNHWAYKEIEEAASKKIAEQHGFKIAHNSAGSYYNQWED